MDDVFGEDNFLAEIKFRTTSNRTAEFLPLVCDSLVVFARNRQYAKFRRLFLHKTYASVSEDSYGCIELPDQTWRRLTRDEKSNPGDTESKGRLFGLGDLTSSHEYIRDDFVDQRGKRFTPKRRYWSTSLLGLKRLDRASRMCDVNGTLRYRRYFYDTPVYPLANVWMDTGVVLEPLLATKSTTATRRQAPGYLPPSICHQGQYRKQQGQGR